MAINLMEPVFDDEMLEAATKALTEEFFLKGESVKRFENEFGDYIGVKHARAVNSGTTALHLSLLAMGITQKDLVITTPASFIATANAIRYTSAKPIFVDISLQNYNIDVDKLRNKVKELKNKVKAIVPVHLYGYPSNMDEIIEIAEEFDIKVLEDACQAHGGRYKGKKLGSLGDAAAFSFYPSKNMTVGGDGGMVTSNNDEIIEKIEMYRDCGRSKKDGNLHEVIGYTARMNTVNAAIGRVQLKNLDKWLERRTEIVEMYRKELESIEQISIPPSNNDEIKSAWHLFVIRTKQRKRFIEHMKKNNVRCGVHYSYPIHLQPPYLKLGYKEGMFPNAEKWAKEVVSLPVHYKMNNEQVQHVIDKVHEFFRR
ncbi:MAG: DegT/DnrJ/EryC1/StrS family aminotransferase [Candidatus Helarchaeota archaeon]